MGKKVILAILVKLKQKAKLAIKMFNKTSDYVANEYKHRN